jgi:hypothetical protein
LVLGFAVRQRAKFEGWLKFEMACRAKDAGMDDIKLEEGYKTEDGQCRADISFRCEGVRYFVELKTSNTNQRMDGVENKIRPITKNIESIVLDAKKFGLQEGVGIVAFVLFPIEKGSDYAAKYLDRIQDELEIKHSLQGEPYTRRINVSIDNMNSAEVIACAFSVPKSI